MQDFPTKGFIRTSLIWDIGKERITADSAEPKSIDQLKGYGLRVKGAEKGKDSINAGIQFIQDFEIIIHPRCVIS